MVEFGVLGSFFCNQKIKWVGKGKEIYNPVMDKLSYSDLYYLFVKLNTRMHRHLLLHISDLHIYIFVYLPICIHTNISTFYMVWSLTPTGMLVLKITKCFLGYILILMEKIYISSVEYWLIVKTLSDDWLRKNTVIITE